MELKELSESLVKLFGVDEVCDLANALREAALNQDTKIMEEFVYLVGGDLSVDWVQKVFQYYDADREKKKQDYTPKSLADLTGRLIGECETVIDLCAGSGALTIQRWNQDKDCKFECVEYDDKAISYLLFNLAIRNIEAVVKRMDVLSDDTFEVFEITKGERFGKAVKL